MFCLGEQNVPSHPPGSGFKLSFLESHLVSHLCSRALSAAPPAASLQNSLLQLVISRDLQLKQFSNYHLSSKSEILF